MAVGAGSIKRASKLNTEAESAKKTVAKAVEKAVEEKLGTAEVAAVEATTEKKEATVKKETVVKKEGTAKKEVTAKKEATTEKVAPAKAVVKVAETNNINPVCHLTEELPIHLL